jgi:hypothetical protein
MLGYFFLLSIFAEIRFPVIISLTKAVNNLFFKLLTAAATRESVLYYA